MRRVFQVLLFALVGLFALSAAAQDPPACPSIKVIGPAGITIPGDTIDFRLESDTDIKGLHFDWSVDIGLIEAGQGTPSISVRTSRDLEGQTVTAKVSVTGLPAGCESSFFETGPIEPLVGCTMPSDDFGDLKPNDVRARLDAFFLELMNSDPADRGIIVITRAKDEPLGESHPRIKLIARHAEFRNFDPARLEFYFEIDEGDLRTQLWRVPPGADDFDPCTSCVRVFPPITYPSPR